MNDADLFRPYLDIAAEKLMWSNRKKGLDVKALRLALRQALIADGTASTHVPSSLDLLVTTLFDHHEAFERVSDEPEWVLKVERNSQAGVCAPRSS